MSTEIVCVRLYSGGKRSSKAVIELDKLEFFHEISEVELP